MSQKTANNYIGLVDYKELEENILSSIRETNWQRGSTDTINKKADRSKFRR
ncbi:MAG: hypothetical protein sL5_05350 [Candidatus Mesenet longicola]|uniref:Uncharacterized protein n=1 Tax=Candidatus Mesenet longicola TaxID=1892558 RepID=A0A8J3HUL8_9RICK|nr:MAG: hypothetical protein sGL2_05660 [Candidatus Mesenet longicola]GHM59542.1 MAG: hypothetical protein sL5_05350 [Candidatus Mesenet longicola]